MCAGFGENGQALQYQVRYEAMTTIDERAQSASAAAGEQHEDWPSNDSAGFCYCSVDHRGGRVARALFDGRARAAREEGARGRATLRATANAVGFGEQAVFHQTRCRRDGAAAVPALIVYEIQGERGADADDADGATSREPVRADCGNEAIGAEAPRLGVLSGDAAGAALGGEELRLNSGTSLRGRGDQGVYTGTGDADDENAIERAARRHDR